MDARVASDQTHRIGRIGFEISAEGEAPLLAIRQSLETAAQSRLAAALTPVLDQVASPEEVVRLERLEIDLGALEPGKDLDPAWLAQRLAAAFRDVQSQTLPEVPPAEAAPRAAIQPIADLRLEVFLTYLRTGVLTGASPDLHLKDLVAGLFAAPLPQTALRQIAAVLTKHPVAVARLQAALDTTQLRMFLQAARAGASTEVVTVVDQILSLLETQGATSSDVVVQSQLHALSRALMGENAHLTPDTDVELDTAPPVPNPFGSPADAEDTPENTAHSDVLPLVNAGLVLLWPFLPKLFEQLELSQSAQDAPRRAQVLHYLATGSHRSEEPDLAIARVLLALPDDVALLAQEPLSDAAMAECDTLLNAVIQHWAKLGNTSPDGLREAFLQRDGICEADLARISVEQNGLDVLLTSLPWALSVVHLPWLARPLEVRWA